jgi:hypothetical protein
MMGRFGFGCGFDMPRRRIVVTPTPTPTPSPADYTATTESELTDILALGAATLNNKRVALASGNWAQRTLTLAPASKVTFVAQNPASRPNLIRWRIGAGAANLFFEDLRFVTDSWDAANDTDVLMYFGTGNVGACTWTRCGFKGGYGGPGSSGNLWENDIDPTGTTRYPEYACILPTFDGTGAVVGSSISRDNVAGLMADGTYPLTFNNASGVTFSSAPTGWTMTVAGGVITNVTPGTGGASNASTITGVGVRSNLITWTGQRRMNAYMKFGVVRQSGITVTGLQTWIDCDFVDLLNAIKFIPTGGAYIEGCTFQRVYMDTISLGIASDGATGGPVTVRFNTFMQGFSRQGDAGDPHADMMLQMFMDDLGGVQTSADWGPITVEGNVVFDGNTRGHGQMILMADNPQNIYYKDVRIVGNIGLSKLSTVGVQSEGMRNGYIYRNTIARFAYDATENVGTSVNCSITPAQPGWNPVGEQTFFDSNISESFSGMDGGMTTGNGIVLGSQGASIPYATVFAAPPTAAAGSGTWPTTRAGVVAAFSPTAGYVGKGAAGSDGYIDYVARTINTAMEPVFVKFTNLSNQVVGSSVSSEWRKILGGPATGTYTVTNGTVQFADDVTGTGATAATTSGSYTRGKYMRLNLTNSASGSTATTATITFNGTWARSFASTTVSAASYPVVAMDSTTPDLFRRASGTLGADANVGTIALTRFKMAAPPAAVETIFGSSSGTARVQVQLVGTTGKLRINLYNGTSQLWRIESNINVCDGVARDILISWDTAQTVESAGRSVYIDGLPDSSSAATWGTGGQVVSYSASLNAYQFGPATGNNIEIGAFYLNVAARVDLTDAANRAKFGADLIGTNGTGPTGAQPVIFLVGNDAQWNAGLNRGSGGVHNPVGSAAVALVSGAAWS